MIQDTLNERESTHGGFSDSARVTQELKMVLHCENAVMTDTQKEAIDMICHKLGRIVCGNPNHKDHWHDIAGYATLVENELWTTH